MSRREPGPTQRQIERLENGLVAALEERQDGDAGQPTGLNKDATEVISELVASVLDEVRKAPAGSREICVKVFAWMVGTAALIVRALARVSMRERKSKHEPSTTDAEKPVIQVSPTVRRRKR